MIVGVLGAGQLGRMLALAGYPLGLRFRFLDPSPDAPAAQVAECITADFTDESALERFSEGLGAATFEFESVPVAAVRSLAGRVPVYPPPEALEEAQDRLREKTLFRRLQIPTPCFAAVDTETDLRATVERIGLPAVLKTRRYGYDGKGQLVLHRNEDVQAAWDALRGVPLLLEAHVAFERELSILAVRGRSGESAFYPLVENRHERGMLRRSLAPARGISQKMQAQAQEYASRILDAVGYVGVLAVEFFQHNGLLLANEIAPRVHNSGHWTIEGAETSQFENHLRAILGLPLGSTSAFGESVMLNMIGAVPSLEQLLGFPGAHVHLYGKSSAHERKLGHLTFRTLEQDANLDARVDKLLGGTPRLSSAGKG
jgi:5-(carboxyamino)imidazole ribonucleotide synthase